MKDNLNSATIVNEKNPPNQDKEGYKKTKIGWIPEDWKLISLGNAAQKIGSGKTPKGGHSVYKKIGRPLVRSQNVGWGHLMLQDIAFIDDELHNTFKSTELQLHDVLLNITGASIGRSALATKKVAGGNVNQHVCIIRPTTDIIPSYLVSYLSSARGQNQIDNFQAGGNRQGLNFSQIRSFSIPLPPLPEQQKIAQILTTWDNAITKTEQLISKKQKRKKGLMQQLLTGKKRFKEFVKSDKLKATKLGEIPEDWEVKKVSDVFDFLSTNSFSRNQLNFGSSENCIYNIHYGDIHARYKKPILDFDVEKSVPIISDNVNIPKSPSYLQNGDVIIADASEDYNGVGEAIELKNINNKKVLAGLHTFALRDNSSLTSEGFRAYIFKNPKVSKALKVIATGSKVFGISRGNLSQFELILPNINEQKKIGSLLSSANKEIDSLQNQLSKLKEQKKGLMQKLLTGEVRVKI